MYELRIGSTVLTTESQTELNWLRTVGKTANAGFVAEGDWNAGQHTRWKVNSNVFKLSHFGKYLGWSFKISATVLKREVMYKAFTLHGQNHSCIALIS